MNRIRRRGSCVWPVALAALIVLAPQGVRAEPQKEAEQEMELAQDALDHNDYPAALQHFSSAQTLAPNASGPLLGLGLTYAAIDRCQEAVPLLQEYRRRKGPSANPKAERAIEECSHKPRNGTLVLETRPTGVEVFRDIPGQPLLGKTPLVSELPVGRHTLLLRKNGYLMSTVTVQIRSGQETRELAGLRAEGGGTLEEPVAPPPKAPVTTPPPAPRAEPQLVAVPPEREAPKGKSRTGLWIGLGVGIGLVVVVGVTVGAVLGTRKDPAQFPAIVFSATQ